MRPIDADTLKHALSESSLVSSPNLLTLFNIINSQPTVCDTSMIIEQINNLKTMTVDIGYNTKIETLRKDVVLDTLRHITS